MKMATGTENSEDLSGISKDAKPGACGKEAPPVSNGTATSILDVSDAEITENPDKFFQSLSSKIEDQLRMLEWEMTSNFQEDAISDLISGGYEDPFSDTASDFNENGTESEFVGYKPLCLGTRKRSKDISITSSVSSVSSLLDDDEKDSDIGADGDIENNTSESSRSGSGDSGKCILAASIMLVEGDRRKNRTVENFVLELVNSIMRDVSTIFTNDREAMLWSHAFDSNIIPTMSTSYNQYHNETDKNIAPKNKQILFSKTFSGEQVTFSDDRWFPQDQVFQFPEVHSSGGVRRRHHRRHHGSERSDEPERRIFHKACYQMHDIQHELRRLSRHLHDIKDDRAESSDTQE